MGIVNGIYQMRAIREKAEFGKSGADGTTMQVAIPCVVTERGQFKDMIVMWNGTFKPGDPVRITMDGLKVLGWDGTKPIANLNGVGHTEFSGTVEVDPKYGPKITRVKEPGKQYWQGGLMSKEELAGLDAIADQARAPQAGGQRRRPASGSRSYADGGEWDGQGAPPGGGDEDIPF